MLRLSPRSRWVVLPDGSRARRRVATAVAWASASNGSGSSSAAAPASFDGGRTAGGRSAADRAAADRAAAEPADRAEPASDHPAGRAAAADRVPVAQPPPRPETDDVRAGSEPDRAATDRRHRAPPPAPSGGVTTQVVTLTNAERAKAGCGPLAVNATLTAVAQAHSQDMATNDYFDHNSQDGRTPFDRMTAAGYRYSTAAENIAAGQRTPQDVMTAWMNSPGHRRQHPQLRPSRSASATRPGLPPVRRRTGRRIRTPR